VRSIVDGGLDPELRHRIEARARRWLARLIERRFGPLAAAIPPEVRGPARGIVFQLAEALGALARPQLEELIRALGAAERKMLGRFGVRIGTESVYLARLCNTAGLRLAALLWALHNERAVATLPPVPATPRSWWRADEAWPDPFYLALGYRLVVPRGDRKLGALAVRLDRIEALAAAARRLARQGGFAATPALASAAALPLKIVPAALLALGYRFKPGEGGGLFSAARPSARSRQPAEAPANPCSPFAQLRELTGRARR
jgi:ATP-dependent RNA helicase SUPV3L1/SUV3